MNLSNIHPKVWSAASGAAISGALTTIVIYVLQGPLNLNLPDTVLGAIGTLLAALFSIVGGYLGPDRAVAPPA